MIIDNLTPNIGCIETYFRIQRIWILRQLFMKYLSFLVWYRIEFALENLDIMFLYVSELAKSSFLWPLANYLQSWLSEKV